MPTPQFGKEAAMTAKFRKINNQIKTGEEILAELKQFLWKLSMQDKSFMFSSTIWVRSGEKEEIYEAGIELAQSLGFEIIY